MSSNRRRIDFLSIFVIFGALGLAVLTSQFVGQGAADEVYYSSFCGNHAPERHNYVSFDASDSSSLQCGYTLNADPNKNLIEIGEADLGAGGIWTALDYLRLLAPILVFFVAYLVLALAGIMTVRNLRSEPIVA